MKKPLRYLVLFISFLLILYGLAHLGLYFFGTETTAKITSVLPGPYTRTSAHDFSITYQFSLPDHSVRRGFGLAVSSKQPTGSLAIVYFAAYPAFNSPYGSGLFFFFLLWSGLGSALLVFQGRKLREKQIEQESKLPRSFYRNLILLAAIGLLLIAAYAIYEQRAHQSTDSADIGNTVGNIANGGFVLQMNDKIFYLNWQDENRLYSMNLDGSERKQLTKESVDTMNGLDGWIYYTNFSDQSKLYKIRADGAKRSCIYPWQVDALNICGEWLYFTNLSDLRQIYKLKTDGSHETQLNQDESRNVLVAAGWIYYNNSTDADCLYRIRLDGKERTKLTDFNPGIFWLEGNQVYFCNAADDGKLYTMSVEGKEIRLFSAEQAGYLNFDQEYFYYTNLKTGGQLYRMGKEGGNPEKLSDLLPFTISLTQDYLVIVDFWDSDQLIFLRKNGSVLVE